MSAFIDDNGNFIKFYGTSILADIKNIKDLDPMLSVVKSLPGIVPVSRIYYKVFDVFSQTLATLIGEKCPRVDEWYKANSGQYYPYRHMPYDVILDSHYEAKTILRETVPKDFYIYKNIEIKVYNGKLILAFDIDIVQKRQLKVIVSSLNDVYGIKRGITRYIVLGYCKPSFTFIPDSKLNLLQSLIPKRLYIGHPDVYHYSNMNTFFLYSDRMY